MSLRRPLRRRWDIHIQLFELVGELLKTMPTPELAFFFVSTKLWYAAFLLCHTGIPFFRLRLTESALAQDHQDGSLVTAKGEPPNKKTTRAVLGHKGRGKLYVSIVGELTV